MTRRGNQAYLGASVVRCVRLSINGTDGFMTEYRGTSSRGFKTDFEQVPTRWIVLTYSNGRSETWTYSGNRLAKADKDWDASIADFRKGGGTVTVASAPPR